MIKDLIRKTGKAFASKPWAILAISLPFAFVCVTAIWLAPIAFKGYPAIQPEWHMVISARNYAQHGIVGSEDALNRVVSPDTVASSVQTSSLGNKLTSVCYGLLFRLFGDIDWRTLYLLAIIISALSAIIFTIVVFRLLGLIPALLFPFVYAFLPFNAEQSQFVGTYEFSLLFFSLFCLLYFGRFKAKLENYLLPAAGIFLALAGLAREAMYVFVPILGLWLLYKREWKKILLIFIPAAIVILGLPLAFGWHGDDYIKLLTNQEQGAAAVRPYSDFDYYSHLYPDPYTYQFERQAYLAAYKDRISSAGFPARIDLLKSANNMGEMKISLWQRFLIGSNNLLAHLARFFSLEVIGGPLVFLMIVFGWWKLRGDKNDLFWLTAWWIGGMTFILSYATLVIRSHLMDYGWLLAALVAFGLYSLRPIVNDLFLKRSVQAAAFIFVILMFLYSMVLSDRVYWAQSYGNSDFPTMEYLSAQISNYDFSATGVGTIAVGCRDGHNFFNFTTGKTFIYFDPETVKSLAADNKLNAAFADFGVKYIACFDEADSELILKNSSAKNISSWPQSRVVPAVSSGQSFFLNLVR